MEQLVELTKALHTSMQLQQQQQQQLLQQETFKKSQIIFQEELIHLRGLQTKITKLYCDKYMGTTKEHRFNFFFFYPEGIRYQNSSMTWTME